ncbi:hypothetical protein H4R33_005159 [Dimargaris cristalligena]|nr:hypothetical protein H4R33_005159 [Dimargaris cristalligena]
MDDYAVQRRKRIERLEAMKRRMYEAEPSANPPATESPAAPTAPVAGAPTEPAAAAPISNLRKPRSRSIRPLSVNDLPPPSVTDRTSRSRSPAWPKVVEPTAAFSSRSHSPSLANPEHKRPPSHAKLNPEKRAPGVPALAQSLARTQHMRQRGSSTSSTAGPSAQERPPLPRVGSDSEVDPATDTGQRAAAVTSAEATSPKIAVPARLSTMPRLKPAQPPAPQSSSSSASSTTGLGPRTPKKTERTGLQSTLGIGSRVLPSTVATTATTAAATALIASPRNRDADLSTLDPPPSTEDKPGASPASGRQPILLRTRAFTHALQGGLQQQDNGRMFRGSRYGAAYGRVQPPVDPMIRDAAGHHSDRDSSVERAPRPRPASESTEAPSRPVLPATDAQREAAQRRQDKHLLLSTIMEQNTPDITPHRPETAPLHLRTPPVHPAPTMVISNVVAPLIPAVPEGLPPSGPPEPQVPHTVGPVRTASHIAASAGLTRQHIEEKRKKREQLLQRRLLREGKLQLDLAADDSPCPAENRKRGRSPLPSPLELSSRPTPTHTNVGAGGTVHQLAQQLDTRMHLEGGLGGIGLGGGRPPRLASGRDQDSTGDLNLISSRPLRTAADGGHTLTQPIHPLRGFALDKGVSATTIGTGMPDPPDDESTGAYDFNEPSKDFFERSTVLDLLDVVPMRMNPTGYDKQIYYNYVKRTNPSYARRQAPRLIDPTDLSMELQEGPSMDMEQFGYLDFITNLRPEDRAAVNEAGSGGPHPPASPQASGSSPKGKRAIPGDGVVESPRHPDSGHGTGGDSFEEILPNNLLGINPLSPTAPKSRQPSSSDDQAPPKSGGPLNTAHRSLSPKSTYPPPSTSSSSSSLSSSPKRSTAATTGRSYGFKNRSAAEIFQHSSASVDVRNPRCLTPELNLSQQKLIQSLRMRLSNPPTIHVLGRGLMDKTAPSGRCSHNSRSLSNIVWSATTNDPTTTTTDDDTAAAPIVTTTTGAEGQVGEIAGRPMPIPSQDGEVSPAQPVPSSKTVISVGEVSPMLNNIKPVENSTAPSKVDLRLTSPATVALTPPEEGDDRIKQLFEQNQMLTRDVEDLRKGMGAILDILLKNQNATAPSPFGNPDGN